MMSLSVAVLRGSEKSGREKTKEEGGGSEREGKGGAVGGLGKGEGGEGVKGEKGEGVKGEEGEGVKGGEGEGVKSEEGDGVKEGEGVKREDKKCEGFTCPNHVTEPLVVHNTNVSYITYHQCCHAPSLSDIKLSLSHSTQCLYYHPAQPLLCTCPPITLTLSPTPPFTLSPSSLTNTQR